MSPHSAPIRVMCVDDHPIFKRGIEAVLSQENSMEYVGSAASGEQALSLFQKLRPDVTLMDLHLPSMSGVEAIVAIRSEFPDAKIIVLSNEAGDVYIQRALIAGAKGYALKDIAMDKLLELIKAVNMGRTGVQDSVAVQVTEYLGDKGLSRREVDVLALAAEGKRNKGIAAALSISDDTVKMHMKHIMEKLNASDRTHAVTIAIRRGFLEPAKPRVN